MAEYHLRRAKPGQRFTITGADGELREIVADDKGVVEPKDAVEDAALNMFELRVARSAEAERRAEDEAEPVLTAGPDAEETGNG
jgi:hypothetical protein